MKFLSNKWISFFFLFSLLSSAISFAQNQSLTFTSAGAGPARIYQYMCGSPPYPTTGSDPAEISVVPLPWTWFCAGDCNPLSDGYKGVLQHNSYCGSGTPVKAGDYTFFGNFSAPQSVDLVNVSCNLTDGPHVTGDGNIPSANPTLYFNGVAVPNSSTASFTYSFSQGMVTSASSQSLYGVHLSPGKNSFMVTEQGFDGGFSSLFTLDWNINVTWTGAMDIPAYTPSPTPTPSGNPPCHHSFGDPVDTLTGKPSIEINDFNYQRPGFPLKFTRYYMKNLESPLLDLGRDWMTDYDKAIISPTSDFSQATVVQPGSLWTHTNPTNGNYTAPAGSCDRLTDLGTSLTGASFLDQNITNSPVSITHLFMLTDKFGTRHYFGVFGGGNFSQFGWTGPSQFIARYLGSLDLNGNAIAISYSLAPTTSYTAWTTDNGVLAAYPLYGAIALMDFVQPTSVSFSNGPWTINFSYTQGRLTQVTNSVGDKLNFSWSGTHLLGPNNSISVPDPTAPLSSVARLFNNVSKGMDSSYGYSTDQHGNYELIQKDDLYEGPGQKHISYVRGNPSSNRVTQVLNGRTTTQNPHIQHQFQYSDNGDNVSNETTTIMDPQGATVEVDHYVNGFWNEKDLFVNGTSYPVTYQRDANGSVTQMIDGNNHGTTMTYDGLFNVTSVKDATGRSVSIFYNQYSQPTSMVDGNLNVTYYTYSFANLTQVQQPGRTINLSYGPFSGLVQKVDVDGQRPVQFVYDNNGYLQGVIYPSPGGTTGYHFDSRGRLQDMTDAMGQMTHYLWDPNRDLLQQVLYPDGTSEGYTHTDFNLNVSSYTDRNLNTTNYAYDKDDNLTTVTPPSPGAAIQYGFDDLNRLVSVNDSKNGPTSYIYNEQNLVVTRIDDVGTKTFSYDGALNLKTKIERGITTTYNYYNNNWLQNMIFSDGTASVSFGYDGNKNVTIMSDAEGTKYFYPDALNRVVTIQNSAEGVTLTYGYDDFDNVTSLKNSKQTNPFTYTYTNNNLLSTVTDPDNQPTTYFYNPVNQVTEVDYANKAKSLYGYNPQNHRLTSLKHVNSSNEIINQFLYTLYDGNGNIKKIQDLVGTRSYSYDALNRLTQAVYAGPKGTIGYGYDVVGNPTTITYNGAASVLSFGGGNTIISGLGETFNHDGSGNISYRSGGNTTYTWDALNRLTGVQSSTANISYVYDGFNRRVRKINNSNNMSVTTNYVFDGISSIMELDASGNTKTAYNPGLSMSDNNGNKWFYLPDEKGDTVGLLDGAQNLVHSYSYDAFGTAIGVKKDNNPSRFVGGSNVASDDDSNLQYMWNRWYDPKIGRFVSQDPMGFSGGINFYKYSRDNPLGFIDPSGLLATGFSISQATEGGIVAGAAQTGSKAVGGFFDQDNGFDPSFGRFKSWGGFVGGGDGSRNDDFPDMSYPTVGYPAGRAVVGGYGGGGASVWFSNARNVNDMLGPFKNYSVNAAWILKGLTAQLSFGTACDGKSIWMFSFGLPGWGVGFGADYSQYQTNTEIWSPK